jgi:hypothetical protein
MAVRLVRKKDSPELYNPINSILSVGGISGFLAVLIVLAIGGRYFIHGPEEVPSILAYALSTIIGFYFGAGISRANTTADADAELEYWKGWKDSKDDREKYEEDNEKTSN